MFIAANAIEYLPKIPSESIDLLITDPPYKLKTGGGKIEDGKCVKDPLKSRWIKKDNHDFIQLGQFFKNIPSFDEWLPECYRVLKNKTHAYIFCSGDVLKDLQIAAEKAGFKYQNLLVWKKQNKTPNQYYMKQCEFILMLRKGAAKPVKNRGISTVIEIPNIISNKVHPTQKPLKLIELLIEQSSEICDKVLDPFGGCGVLVKACLHTLRNSVVIEIEEKYVKGYNENYEKIT